MERWLFTAPFFHSLISLQLFSSSHPITQHFIQVSYKYKVKAKREKQRKTCMPSQGKAEHWSVSCWLVLVVGEKKNIRIGNDIALVHRMLCLYLPAFSGWMYKGIMWNVNYKGMATAIITATKPTPLATFTLLHSTHSVSPQPCHTDRNWWAVPCQGQGYQQLRSQSQQLHFHRHTQPISERYFHFYSLSPHLILSVGMETRQ